MKNIKEFSGKRPGKWSINRKNDNTKRATGVDRRTRAEKEKWNQMTALRV